MSGITELHVSDYVPHGDMAAHAHDEAWFCLVIAGGYEERILGQINEHEPGDLLFCPAHATHALSRSLRERGGGHVSSP